jgi:hypothetical protein
MCARDPDRGEWRVPVPSDGWRWRDDGVDAETLRREMDEAEKKHSGPRRVVARRETDDAFRVFGVPGYGEALRGVALDVPGGGSGNDDSRRSGLTSPPLTSESTQLGVPKETSSRGGGFVKSAVFSAKRASSAEIRAWFASTTSSASPKSPAAIPESERAGRAGHAVTGGDTDGDRVPRAGDVEAFRASAASLGAGDSASEWFEAFTKDVALAVGEARRPAKEAFFGAEVPKVPAAGEKSDTKSKPVVATMAPSEAQEGACARVMGALHDAVMRQRARVFYELIKDDIKRYA